MAKYRNAPAKPACVGDEANEDICFWFRVAAKVEPRGSLQYGEKGDQKRKEQAAAQEQACKEFVNRLNGMVKGEWASVIGSDYGDDDKHPYGVSVAVPYRRKSEDVWGPQRDEQAGTRAQFFGAVAALDGYYESFTKGTVFPTSVVRQPSEM